MEVLLDLFVFGMFPVIFFGIIFPMFALGRWVSIEVICNGDDRTWYGLMIYVIIGFWGLGLAVLACAAWGNFWS